MPTETSEWTRLDPTSDRLVLRDGSVAIVRASTVADRPSVQRFFHELAPESRYRRFLAPGEPTSALVAQLCDSSTPARNLTLIALRDHQGGLRPIAIASYAATGPAQAEVAFAVADGLHGRGLGTALLERLAAIARSHGVERFEATTLVDNMEMLEVFRASGFEMQSKTSRGVVEVRLNLQLSADLAGHVESRAPDLRRDTH
jgi:acetate---CoA ligase (ADP-forming)